MKRSDDLRGLSDDHHRALILAKRAKTAAAECDPEAAKALWSNIRQEYDLHLARHFTLEETYLLPALRAVGATEWVDRVARDHAALRRYVLEGQHSDRDLVSFAKLLSDHVRFEERELFPFAEENLAKTDLDRIAQAYKDTDTGRPGEFNDDI